MGKNVGAGLLFDKAETFRFVEPLYGSGNCVRHNKFLNLKYRSAFKRLELLEGQGLNLKTSGRGIMNKTTKRRI
jgi:hypothetical protein